MVGYTSMALNPLNSNNLEQLAFEGLNGFRVNELETCGLDQYGNVQSFNGIGSERVKRRPAAVVAAARRLACDSDG